MARDLTIQNVVASATLGCQVPLEKLVSTLPGTEYEPEQFPGLVYRMNDPRAASLIFSSGKIVCTGTKSPDQAKVAVDKVIRGVKSVGAKVVNDVDMQIQNIVASAQLDSELSLNDIAFSLDNAEYEPEQFPGLVYRMRDPKVAFLLFGSGKLVCTGGKEVSEVHRAVKKVESQLREIGAMR